MRTLSGLTLLLSACLVTPLVAQDPQMAQAQKIFSPIPLTPPALPGNAATPAKVELGKKLYFDPRLSASHAISCNSCHVVGMGGVDGGETSIGHKWQRGGRNAPTTLNAVFNMAQFWDGRAADLEEQAGGPMRNPVEMASAPKDVLAQLSSIPGYVAAFRDAFPGQAQPVSLANAQKAIAVFEATLITPNAPFDKYLRGNASALSAVQKEGLGLFVNKGCVMCHNGVNVGGGRYAPFGQVQKPPAHLLPPGDKGRLAVTGQQSDAFVFRTPTLRNVTLTAPYFHTGRAWDLREAVRVMGTSQLGATLSDREADAVVAFLESLTGEQPRVVYPILPPSVTATPRPAP
ncbi:cytochrome-c peroxidase [Luteitalea sp. TBR-22]|uniref:cytochrome-c peroxidase n=1 Tax=Luteitalea sp. TBR-22 TaxID=2802971 RepID=UPI00351D36FD